MTLNGKKKHLEEKATKAGKTDFAPKLYRDFRKLLEEMDKSIDAVTVSTPAARNTSKPRPACSGLGSVAPTTTCFMPAAMMASVQAPVRPAVEQG